MINRTHPYRTIAGISIVSFLGLVTLLRCVSVVPAGHVGVVDTFGQVSPKVLQPGLHLRNPLSKVVHLSVQTQEIKETTQAPSKEGLMMEVDVSILYRLDPNQASQIYQTVGMNYQEVIVLPQVRSLIRNTTARYNAQELYTTQRQALTTQLRTDLNAILTNRGITIEDTPLRNVALPENLRQSVEAKLQADQESQRMQFILTKEKQEAERKRIEAQGQADAQKILSQGLSEPVLKFRQIEAMQRLADSKNSKVVVLGGDGKNILLQP
ncbi:prohibitin family protein [Alkalinema sp. FACHB-956]|uniref:prohibitin family protein n=1 Tax=Alkalinema sp. FACHB-956 TaxID=2692768 RepID=UPI001687595C|nr:prohibitin family protein [Alkalinema sp. FACHB-956]MBD2326491.1 prohibitin family protein [Alkalinema sp. FACHB-956]